MNCSTDVVLLLRRMTADHTEAASLPMRRKNIQYEAIYFYSERTTITDQCMRIKRDQRRSSMIMITAGLQLVSVWAYQMRTNLVDHERGDVVFAETDVMIVFYSSMLTQDCHSRLDVIGQHVD
jgi:hypothetical protein